MNEWIAAWIRHQQKMHHGISLKTLPDGGHLIRIIPVEGSTSQWGCSVTVGTCCFIKKSSYRRSGHVTPTGGGGRHSQAGSWQADILGLCLGLEFPLHSPMSKHPVSCLLVQNLDLTSASHQPWPSWVALWRRPGRRTGTSPPNYMELYKRVRAIPAFSVSPGHLSLGSPPHTILPEALWVGFFFWMLLQCAFFPASVAKWC